MNTIRLIRPLSALLAAASLASCASATKRLEQGQQLQAQGRPAEAAERYIQALKKDSRLDSARVNLRVAGGQAIEQYLRTAAESMNPYTAADNYLAVDDLQKRALEVGIFLPGPNGYDAAKRTVFDKAIAAAVTDSRLLINTREYAEALRRLQRAATAYQPGPTQVTSLGGSGADVMIAWARADTAQGNFRAAYGRVERIGEVSGATQRQVDEARAIQAVAMSRGTRRVAVIPVWGTVAARTNLPDDALLILDDALNEDPWISPPPFVVMVPPDQVEREVRRQGMARRTLSSFEAARIARTVGADFAVVAEVDSVHREDVNVRVTRRPARTTRGVDTAYYVEEGTARLYARATFSVVDREGQRGTDFQSVSASTTSPFTRIRYNGDYRGLDLRQAERDLFERARVEGDLSRTFASAMSPRLAEAVFAEVSRLIP
jgi:tetratricopeptide (TPR) repeat protein